MTTASYEVATSLNVLTLPMNIRTMPAVKKAMIDRVI